MKKEKLEIDRQVLGGGKKKKKRRHILFMVLFLVLLIFIGVITYLLEYKYYDNFRILGIKEKSDTNTVQYMKYGKNLLRYSRDGASVIDSKGNMLWNGTYDMKEPKADICEGYIVIADIGNKTLYVYDEYGKYEKIETILPINQVKIAKQGVVVAVLQDKHANKIYVYNPYSNSNKILIDFKINIKDGYPMDLDLSEDGTKIVISYISVNNGVADNTVTFYNFSEVGDNVVDKIVGAFLYKQEIVPQVKFLNNDIACAFAEKSFTLYSIKEKPKEIHKEVFQEEIQSIFSNEEYIGFIFKDLEERDQYQVKVYNLKGKNVLTKDIDYDFTHVDIYGDDIIFRSDLESNILRMNGTRKFHKVYDRNIQYLLPMNKWNQYYLIDETNIYKIRLGKEDKE